MSTLSDLIAQREALDRAIAEVKEKSRAEGFEKINSLLDEYQITPTEVAIHFGGLNKSKVSAVVSSGIKPKVAAKYIDKTTGAQWSGRGLKPRWLSAAIDAGAKLEDFTA